jgi:hypothetical protein
MKPGTTSPFGGRNINFARISKRETKNENNYDNRCYYFGYNIMECLAFMGLGNPAWVT